MVTHSSKKKKKKTTTRDSSVWLTAVKRCPEAPFWTRNETKGRAQGPPARRDWRCGDTCRCDELALPAPGLRSIRSNRAAPSVKTRRGTETPPTTPRGPFEGNRREAARTAAKAEAGVRGRRTAKGPPQASLRPSPFWERIASPVLRSPNTDKGPSILAAGRTSSFPHTAGNQRLPVRGPGGGHGSRDGVERTRATSLAGAAGNAAPSFSPPLTHTFPGRAAGQDGKEKGGGGWRSVSAPEVSRRKGRSQHIRPIKRANEKGAKVGGRKSVSRTARGRRRSADAFSRLGTGYACASAHSGTF